MKHILLISSDGLSLLNFRLDLIKKLLSKGYKISVAFPKNKFSDEAQKELNHHRVKVNLFSLSRTGTNIFKELKSILEIYKIIKTNKPTEVISYTAKPVIYSGLILKIFKKINFYPLITGLGYGFIDKSSLRRIFIRFLLIKLYQMSLQSSKKIIFQNQDDRSLFYKLKIISEKKTSEIINGSGVNLSRYPFSDLPKKPIFLMISRLLIDKGVREYVSAAKIVRSKYPKVKFQLAGDLDENPVSIKLSELNCWIKDQNIEYLGKVNSVQSILKKCKFFVLPSYREGVPRSTLEALSTGRPIITTDAPGCRETVINKKNGLMVPIKNTAALAEAMIKLLKEPNINLIKMSEKSFMIAKTKFEIDKVNKKMLKIMNL